MASSGQLQEPIEVAPAKRIWEAWKEPHRRPVLLIAAVMFLVILGASISMVMPTQAAPRRDKDARENLRLQPATKTARDLIGRGANRDAGSDEDVAATGGPARLTVPPEPDAGGGARKTAGAPIGNPPGPQARVEPTFEERQRKQHEEYLLAEQAARMKMRIDSLKTDTLVDSFDRVRRDEAEEIAGLFGGDPVGGDPSSGGAAPGIADVTRMANAAMKALGGMGRNASAGAAGNPQADALLGLMGRGGAGSGGGNTEDEAAAYQEKLAFFQNGGQQLPSGDLSTKMKAARPYTLLMGHEIRGMLLTKTVSEAPGILKGQVIESVRDRNRNLLIPQGTEIVGTYSARLAQGNARLQVAWTRLNFPDGRSLDLESMPGASTDGSAGLTDQVDRHIAKRLGAVLMSSVFTVGYELTIPQTGNLLGSAVSRGVGENVTNFGVDLAREIGRQQPTITLRQGEEILILLNKDVSFPGPYEDGVERSTIRTAPP